MTVKVPKNIVSLKKFSIDDTPTNLEDDSASVKVYKDGSEVTGFYDVTPNGNGFTISFTPSLMSGYEGETLTIKYNAKLLNSASVDAAGNSNAVKLHYSNQILPTTIPGEEPTPTENTIEDTTYVYTFRIDIVKTAENKTTRLGGVVFDLYKQVKTSKLTTEEAGKKITKEEAEKLGLPVDADSTWTKITTLTTSIDEDPAKKGTAEYKGLASGTYYLVETKTVDQYNLLSAPVKVELSVSAKTTWTKKSEYDAEGNLVKHAVSKKTTVFDNSENASTGYVVTNIINRKGFQLPVTGGFGTLLFSGIGVLLVLAGVSVLFSLKKKNKRA